MEKTPAEIAAERAALRKQRILNVVARLERGWPMRDRSKVPKWSQEELDIVIEYAAKVKNEGWSQGRAMREAYVKMGGSRSVWAIRSKMKRYSSHGYFY